MSQLESEIIKMIHNDVQRVPDDGLWRTYEKSFTYEKENYIVKCSFRVDNFFLTYKNLHITKEQQIIMLPQRGLH